MPNRNRLLFALLMFAGLHLFSCKTVYKTGYEKDRAAISVDLSQHQLAYRFQPDAFTDGKQKETIDRFDSVFFRQLYRQLLLKQLNTQVTSTFLNVKLEQCLIDFTLDTPSHSNPSKPALRATLICTETSDSTRVFYASSLLSVCDTCEVKPHEEPAILLAKQLGSEAANAIEESSKKAYTSKYPDRAAQIYKEQEPSRFGNVIFTISLILFLILIN